MPTKTGSYKGSPTISLLEGEADKYPFSFGVKKARLILANLDDIREFVRQHETPQERARREVHDSTNAFVDSVCGDRAYEDRCQAITGA